eukprot:2071472-Pyramimonas_sp.AAC.1
MGKRPLPQRLVQEVAEAMVGRRRRGGRRQGEGGGGRDDGAHHRCGHRGLPGVHVPPPGGHVRHGS